MNLMTLQMFFTRNEIVWKHNLMVWRRNPFPTHKISLNSINFPLFIDIIVVASNSVTFFLIFLTIQHNSYYKFILFMTDFSRDVTFLFLLFSENDFSKYGGRKLSEPCWSEIIYHLKRVERKNKCGEKIK